MRDKISRSFLDIGVALVVMVTGAQADSRPVEAFGKVALAFVANSGQTDEQVKFIARSASGSLFSTHFFLTQQGAVLLLNQMAVRMTMVGANPDTPVEGLELLPGKSNYLIGNDKKQWRTDVPNYGKVRYREAWLGVDVVYHGNQQQLEYDFVIKPGADPDSIRLRFEGAEQIEIDGTGELVLRTSRGEIRQHKPVIYQEAGVRKPIQGGYELVGENEVRFQLSNYDRSRSLVIDPTLVYSTFLGGSGRDLASAIAVDSSGAAYVTGTTLSPNFPVVGGATVSSNQGVVFVSKLNSAGTALVYSTEISGPDNGDCTGRGIAVDALGNAYVTGNTASGNFPTVNAIQGTFGGVVDAFIFKLSPSGNALFYSTYVGGNRYDSGMGVAVDSSGNAYITGWTGSLFVHTSPGAFRSDPSFATNGTFVTKLNATGGRVYTTVLDPKAFSFTIGNAIAADNAGNAYVTGSVGIGLDGSPPAFPTTPGAFQTTFRGVVGAFVTKLNPAGTALVYSTFLCGSGDVQGAGIAVDASGAAYVVGRTNASDFPGPISGSALTRATDAFIVKLNPAGTALVYGRYLGGVHDDDAKAVSVDAAGNAYVTGSTSSPDFPLTNALQTAPVGLGGPIFRSALNPSSWFEASAGIVTEISQIVVHPRMPSLLYAVGLSGGNSSVDIIYKSTDSGATWSNSGFPTNLFTFALFFDPSNPSILYQVAATGVFKSTNEGASWIRTTGGLPVNAKGAAPPLISTYAFDTVNTNILYLGLGSAVYVTRNGGVNWSPVGSGLPSSPFTASLSTDPFTAGVVYATITSAGIFKSTDAGRTWTLVYRDPAISGGSLKFIAPGTGYLYNSFGRPLLKMTNGGGAWTLANFNGPRVTTVAADPGDPNRIYLGTTTGVYATADGGNTWARLGPTLASSSVKDIEIDPTNTANLYAVVFANVVPYVAKVNAAGTALVYSTYLAGSAGSYDQAGGAGISVDNRGNVYVTGGGVPSFPTTLSAIYPAPLGDTDSFIAKIGDATAPCSAQVTAHNSFYPAGGADFDFVNVISSAGCAWTASTNNSWLTIVAGASGVGTGQVYISVAPNLTSGRGGSISVNDGSGIQRVNVTQAVGLCSAAPSTVLIGQTLNGTLTSASCPAGFRGPSTYYTDEYLFSASAGQQVAVKLNSTAFDAFLYVQDPDGNIFADADSGGGTNSRIPAHNDFLRLASGMYTIAVTSQRAGGVGDYTLSLTAGGPGLVASPSALAFTVPLGSGSVVQTVNVTFNGSPVTITSSAISTASGKTWLQVFAFSDAATVTVNPSVLPAGASDTGTVTLFTPSGQLSFKVSVTIGSDNTGLVATPSVVTFDALSGSETVVQNVNVTFNGSPATVTGVEAMTTTGEDWLLPSLSDTPGSVTVGVNSSALSPGSYTGSVIVNTTAGTVTISVNITVSA